MSFLGRATTLLTFALGLSTGVPAVAQAGQSWTQIPIPPLHAFNPRQPTRVELPNGLVLFLEEDHELPFIDGSILIRGGRRDEPSGKTGLINLYGQTWRTSGTTKVNGDTLDDQMENKGARIETSGGLASTSLSWSSLKSDFDGVFALATDLLLHPAFNPEKLDLAKQQVATGISRRNDSAEAIAGREVSLLAYGRNSPYGRQIEYATIAAVTIADLETWHGKTVIPNGIIVAVSGDFDSKQMEAKLRSAFGDLKRGTPIAPEKADFPGPKPGVFFVEKNDVNQSSVNVFGLGTERNNPDLYALDVMNEIFSGGFSSRVFKEVRTRLGLAYSVGGSYGASYDHPGLFVVGVGTKSESTVPATKAVLDQIGKLKTEPPSAEELKNAKDQVLNSFIFNYDSPDKILNEQTTLAFYGYPLDFVEKYRVGVEKVSAADVSRVANKYIDVSKLAIIVVGNDQQMKPPLSALGVITPVDVTIPPPPGGGSQAPQAQ
jgi:zinc protease